MSVRYCGRDFSPQDIQWIKAIIDEDKTRTSAKLSRLVCRQLHWLEADGGLKGMLCSVSALRMEADGLFVLPAPTGTQPLRQKIRFTE